MPQFFDNFPLIDYYNNKVLRNIILKARIIREIFNNFDNFYPYVVEEWERPDTIAADYYGDSKYYWVVLMSNDLVDPYFEWPLSYLDFVQYMEKKYNMTVDQTKSLILHYQYNGIGGNIDDMYGRKTWTLPVETFNYFDRELTGTLNLNNSNGVIVEGTGTIFEVELTVGDEIYINTGSDLLKRTVASISSNTLMTIDADVAQSNTAAKYKMYYDPLGIENRFSPEGWFPVYAYDYEVDLNDKKRSIRLLNKTYVAQVERELRAILGRDL